MKRDFILKYKYNGTVKVLELKAKTKDGIMKKFNRMKKECRLYNAKMLEIKEKDCIEENLFSTHPMLEQFHI